MTTWFITGASSGLGAALARAVLDHGDNAAITARTTGHVQGLLDTYPDGALAVCLDVTDHDQVVAAVNAATERFGAVDVLVNNAGHGYRAAVEEAAVDEVDELFATNFFGPVDLIKQVLPRMRARRRTGALTPSPQRGAPDKAAAAIVQAAEDSEPPKLLLLGSDALDGFHAAADAAARDIGRFEELSLSTDATS